ncbi:HEAT repeat domain-containing protein [Embleya hyalina]|uniref:HEAT repeat domain-containing protein n=1 Tax=Embleya hyalina TaxID=516124 RepID=A0A401YG80_9ACTN|nr:HEAT repeat domain-containing protein [Embleya hyalina]GCD93612.1 hypothetical protein EHYA_01257 [Embleya hyalina]
MVEWGPLAGLDGIDWAGSGHAYGSAEDVPEQLRALRSADAGERGRALDALYGNIFHQGSRYEATAQAVPFLLALVADPGTPDRAELVHLLAALAIGFDEVHLPDGVAIADWRAAVGRARAEGEEGARRRFDGWIAEADGEVERRARERRRDTFDFEKSCRAAEYELRAYDAVRAGVPTLCGVLTDPDPRLRAAAAHAVGWFPEEAPRILPRLRDLPATEPVPGVAANAIVAIGLLGDAAQIAPLRAYHQGTDEPLARWAAAIALARLGAADLEVIAELAACTVDPPTDDEAVPMGFFDGDLRAYASSSLVALEAGELPVDVLESVLAGLSRTSGPAAFAITDAALRLAFGTEARATPAPAFADLPEARRRVVATLAELDVDTWKWVNFRELLRARDLPDDRAACRRYAGLAED